MTLPTDIHPYGMPRNLEDVAKHVNAMLDLMEATKAPPQEILLFPADFQRLVTHARKVAENKITRHNITWRGIPVRPRLTKAGTA